MDEKTNKERKIKETGNKEMEVRIIQESSNNELKSLESYGILFFEETKTRVERILNYNVDW